jgi:putative glutamine amidotransferase
MPYEVPHHQVELLENTLLRRIVGHQHISVNSMHHQAVLEPAPGFIVSAVAPDGLIEAIECPEKRFLLGVQWHPEHMWQNYASGKKIWQAFVDACR